MEIKNISGIVNVYNKIKLNSGKTKVAPAEKKTDKIEFNFARSVEAAKADLAAAVNENTSAERIEALSDSVASGSYDVSPEMIADSILMFLSLIHISEPTRH